jgi:ATP-dependent exoDNAse (exonuclease V) beta subunit
MISDSAARETALQVDGSFIVQAPAGSGKTGLLVFRILKLLATVDQPQKILAITFTRKATAEMRNRVVELLEMAEQGVDSPIEYEQYGINLAAEVLVQDKKHAWNLIETPSQLQIMTIDALCSKLAGSMPWLSRLGDRPRTTDNADKHYGDAVELLFSELLNEQSTVADSLQVVLEELDFNYARSRVLFKSMLAKRDQWLRHLLQQDLSKLRAHIEYAWQTLINEQLADLSQSIAHFKLEQLAELAVDASTKVSVKGDKVSPLIGMEGFDRNVRFMGIAQWLAIKNMLLTGKEEWRKQLNITIGFKSKTPEHQALTAIIDEFREDGEQFRLALVELNFLPEAKFLNQDWEQMLHLEKVLKFLAAALQLRFRSTGECDHSEVTQRANLALQELDDPTELGLRLDAQIQHILVDEFQDTSHGQIELLKRMTAGWGNEEGFENRSLFLVGDPMQSIYRFREADVSLFLRVTSNATTKIFPNIKVQPLSLTQNFRSSQSLVEWFNKTFKHGFAEKDDPVAGAIRYAKATSNKPGSDLSVSKKFSGERSQEIESIVDAITTALENCQRESDQVAILVRSRGQLKELLPAIEAEGIAYAGIDIHPLKDVQAIIDVVALCKAICREDDRVSWLSLLRGPWCGLNLYQIKALTNDFDKTLWQQICAADEITSVMDEAALQRLQRFREIMAEALVQRQRVSLSSLTRWAWQALGGEATLAETDLKNIETVFTLLSELQSGGDLPNVSELERGLDGLFAQPTTHSEGRSPQLVVSTIHKAKGLQYHTVILPSLASPPRADDKEVMMWTENQSNLGEAQLLLAPLTLEETKQSSHYGYLRALNRKRAMNESIRLMYVACTRAEQQLILTATVKIDDESNEIKSPAKGSLLAAIWSDADQTLSLNTPLSEQGEQGAESKREQLAQDQLSQDLFRLPGKYKAIRANSIEWAPLPRHVIQVPEIEVIEEELTYEWASEVAAAVGTVLHDWLSHHSGQVVSYQLNEDTTAQWRSDLRALNVAPNRMQFALNRLKKGIENIQADQAAHFVFADYAEQSNEYSISCIEKEVVKTYRIDRTFVDEKGVRWIVDYKSTDTREENVGSFVDQQVALRHRAQLEKYGKLLSQLDDRPIRLAVYFPLLKELRAWDFSSTH